MDKFANAYAALSPHAARCKRMSKGGMQEDCFYSLDEKREKIVQKTMNGIEDRILRIASHFRLDQDQLRSVLESIHKSHRRRQHALVDRLETPRDSIRELTIQVKEIDRMVLTLASAALLADGEKGEMEKSEL